MLHSPQSYVTQKKKRKYIEIVTKHMLAVQFMIELIRMCTYFFSESVKLIKARLRNELCQVGCKTVITQLKLINSEGLSQLSF